MRKVVTIQLEGELPQSQSAYEVAVEEGYEGSEEQYAKSLATIPPTQEQFDAIPGRLSKLIATTEKSDFHHITDSAASKAVDFGMEGNTEQKTTAGNQLFDISQLEPVTNVINGITEVGDDYVVITSYDGYTGNGLASTGKTLRELCPLLEVGGTYLLTATTESATMARIYVGTAWDFGSTAVITEDMLNATVILYGHGYSSIIGSCKISNIQVQEGTTEKDYEPYTNGPSPNPDYPQEIANAGVYNEETGRYEIGYCVGNKNLLPSNSEEWLINYTTSWSGTEGTKPDYYAGMNYKSVVIIDARPDTTMCFHNDTTAKYWIDQIIEIDNDGIGWCNNVLYYNESYNFKDYSFKTTSKTHKLTIQVRLVDDTQTFTEADLQEMKIAFGYGDSVSYTPHQSQQFTLTSPVPLTKWDYLTKRDDVWGWSIWQLPYVFNGSENWYSSTLRIGFSVDCFPNNFPKEFYKYNVGYCNQAIYYNGSFGVHDSTPNNVFWCGIHNSVLSVCKSNFYDDTLEDYGLANWKAHLAENPLEVITYAYEEQSFHPLPDEEQTLLKNLETYYGVTNAYNDQGCPMWLTYVQDTKTAVDNKFNNIRQAILSLGGNV